MMQAVGAVDPQPEHHAGNLPQKVAEVFSGHRLPAFHHVNATFFAGPVHELPGQGLLIFHLAVVGSPVNAGFTGKTGLNPPDQRARIRFLICSMESMVKVRIVPSSRLGRG